MQSALSKERRELKMQERQDQEGVKNPSGISKTWLDPVGAGSTGFDPSMMAGAGKAGGLPADLPEWKKHIIGGSKGSFGRKTNMSILEQRQSLPIYKLKDELIKAINDNQVWFFCQNISLVSLVTLVLVYLISVKVQFFCKPIWYQVLIIDVAQLNNSNS